MKGMHTRPGKSYPLGATYDGHGTNFALFSSVATSVELCLFDSAGTETRIALTQRDADIWHVWVEGVLPGQRYGYRVHGPFDPARGQRCNPSKVLLDPYAKAISGFLHDDESLYSYTFDNPEAATATNTLDDAQSMPKSVVTNPYFDWAGDRHPNIPMDETIIYETHVRGITALDPLVPSDLRGTYAGMAHPSVIDHLKALGVTSIELMPVHHFIQDSSLQKKGLANYWGYNSIGFFAPNAAYSSSGDRGEQVGEFKQMVRAYHDAGLEILLDVVYNHTAEGNHLGPTLSFRGIDNAAYYRLVPGDEAHYFDTTGTGNSLNMNSPRTLQLVVDSLRYWAEEMHVDGFRFDLAATLGRGSTGAFDRNSSFFSMVQADPVLARTKLIAEPWDTGSDGYQVGGFPNTWSEWNGRYRDTARDFWRSQTSTLPVFASRITGSSDIYQPERRKPAASVNFITAHDGFTLRDLVSYNGKHNEANGENGNDGTNDNRSWNCGVEGPTTVRDVEDLRWRQMRNFISTLMVSQGVPMILGGDEIGRTQQGNNNAYCQDNAISWYDWNLSPEQKDFQKFVRRMIHLRRKHPVFRRETYFEGRERRDTSKTIPQIEWFDHTGTIMDRADWDHFYALSLMVFLNGHDIPDVDGRGVTKQDSDFLLIYNAFYEPIAFTLPSAAYSKKWRTVVDTFEPDGPTLAYGAGFTLTAQPYSFLLLEGDAATKPDEDDDFLTPNSLE
jgi:isoamylase